MSGFLKKHVALLITGLLLAAPQATFACSACMGRADNSTTQGLNAAILTLLGSLTLVLGSVVGFIVYLIQRSVKHPLALPSTPGGVTR